MEQVARGKRKICAIVVTYNAMKWIERCLVCLAHSNELLEILLIDNKSTDETLSFVQTNFKTVKIIENGSNLGFGRANNLGLEYFIAEQYDYALLINQDVYVHPGCIENLAAFHLTRPGYGIISPLHLNGDGKELDKHFGDCVSGNLSQMRELEGAGIESLDLPFVNAAAWLLSRDCVLAAGGFDPLFSHYGEDRDYCNRAIYHGFKTGVLLSATVNHDRQYAKNNPYRTLESKLYASGLAYLKNINRPLWSNLVTWSFRRIMKTAKAVVLLKTGAIRTEVQVGLRLAGTFKQICKSRLRCRVKGLTFLETIEH